MSIEIGAETSSTALETLDKEDFKEIVLSADGLDLVLVGGQALNLWAELLYKHAPDELSQYGPFTSKDIDYQGTLAAAKELAHALGGYVEVPSPEEIATPNTAIVVLKRAKHTVIIDILATMAGISSKDFKEGVVSIPIDLGEDRMIVIRVLHPFLVLKARIASLAILRRTDQISIRQMHASLIVLREYILYRLTEGGSDAVKEAQTLVRRVLQLAASPDSDMIYERYHADLIDIVQQTANHQKWDTRFKENQIIKSCQNCLKKREMRLAEKARKEKRQ